MKKSLVIIILLLSNVLPSALAHPPRTFQSAKKNAKVIFDDLRRTFYCGCTYDSQLKINLGSCGYEVRKNKKRASRVEWEHIVPAENFGRNMPSKCWLEPICKKKNGKDYKGRACCLKIDDDFKRMHNDLHNLVPAIGEINGDRSNFRYAELSISDYLYGDCDFKIQFQSRKVEPSDSIKGTVARVYLYYNREYGMKLSKQQRKLFEAWNKKFKPEAWEIEWDSKVFTIQGNHNPYIFNWDSN